MRRLLYIMYKFYMCNWIVNTIHFGMIDVLCIQITSCIFNLQCLFETQENDQLFGPSAHVLFRLVLMKNVYIIYILIELYQLYFI